MKLDTNRIIRPALPLIVIIFGCLRGNLLQAGEQLLVIRNTPLLAGPEPYYRAIDTISNQTVVALIEKKGDWYLVQMANGQAGWLKSENVRTIDSSTISQNLRNGRIPSNNIATSFTPTEKMVQRAGNVREQADIAAKIIGKLVSGQRVKIIRQQGDWFYGQLPNGSYGWVNAVLFRPLELPKAQRYLRVTKNANFRAEPSPKGRIKGVIPAGTTIIVLDSLADWYKVQFQDTSGWINRIVISPIHP